MTDNEIIKALECFAIDKDFDETHCIGCAFEHQFCTANMSEDIAIPALSLINRQKAEIERLTVLAKLGNVRANDYRAMRDKAKTARTDAIKEFAERLKKRMRKYSLDGKDVFKAIEDIDIDNLVKEMVGEQNG